MSKQNLTAERLRKALAYDPQTGIFLRNINSRRRPSTTINAGSTTTNGYIAIYLDRNIYTAHRLAWVYIHGEWPKGDIDHINGNRQDNRAVNLRDVTRSINAQNRRTSQKNKTTQLPLGVSFKRQSLLKPYFSSIVSNGKKIHLGYFASSDKAHEAYLEAKRRMHEGCTI